MILPDVNLLIFAYNPGALQHEAARNWWQNCLDHSEPVGLPWVAVLGFIRIITNPKIVSPCASPREALACVSEWLSLPHVYLLHPTTHHFTLLSECIDELGTAGNLTTDAHLATIAMEHGYILHTTDADFSRFKNLKWVNPLGSKEKTNRKLKN